MNITEIEKELDKLVSDLANCDRDGCLCWEAKERFTEIAKYATERVQLWELRNKPKFFEP